MMNLGAKCGLKDIQRIVYLDNLCTRLGLDAISAGSTIAFAMDLYDRNILKPEDLPMDEFQQHCGEVSRQVFEIVHRYGGSISAEHGVAPSVASRARSVSGRPSNA